MQQNKKISYKKIVLVSILFSFIFLIGCQTTGTTQKFKIGTEGLVITFAPSNPKSIYEGENFGTSIVINNVGSYDILEKNNPVVLKTSIDDYRLKFANSNLNFNTKNFNINGKSKEFPKGDEQIFEFYFNSLRLTNLRESSKTDINYNLCYPYNTELTIVTCIDTKLANRDETAAACKTETYNGGAGQGAPIVITKIVPEIMLQTNYVRPQFKIYIENKGAGYVTNTNACALTNINDRESSGRVNVYAWLSGKPLECGPDNLASLRLVDGESFIRCYLPNSEEGYKRTNKNYITPLTVSIDYTYTLITNQELEIKRDDTLEHSASQECNAYQIMDNNKCVDKCKYCVANPDNSICQENKPNDAFRFGTNFSCSCTLQQCDTKALKGNCNKGFYCPTNVYCCSTNQCDKYQIEFNGQCIDKCNYCSNHPEDTIICSTFNFQGFTCTNTINKEECNTYVRNKACILGFCGGTNIDSYCANVSWIEAKKSNTTIIT